jgi:hypothetical protein
MGETRSPHRTLVGKLLGMLHWKTEIEDNIKIDLQEIGCEDDRSIEVAQDCVQW